MHYLVWHRHTFRLSLVFIWFNNSVFCGVLCEMAQTSRRSSGQGGWERWRIPVSQTSSLLGSIIF